MSLNVFRAKSKLVGILAAGVVIVSAVTAAWFFIKWNFANTVASKIDTAQPEAASVAEWLVDLAPADPQTHFALARVFEKTFNPEDLEKSLAQYERASALSPYNYVMWLNLGKARSLNGDAEAATQAYERALQLAPNYAAVQWTYGNSLIRQGRPDEGFAMIARAAAANPDYARTTALTALEMFDGNLERVRSVLGTSDSTNAALAAVLSRQQRFAEAVDAWSKISPEAKLNRYQQLGSQLAEQMAGAKKFQLAAVMYGDLQGNESTRPTVGQIANGGFEGGVKLRNAGMFEWQIGAGAQPQIGLQEGNAHSGRFCLVAVFNTFAAADFRPVTQIVPVVPGATYELEVFYKSDIKSSASLKWEVAEAINSVTIAATPPLVPAPEWISARVRFSVPRDVDGIIVRLGRDGCSGPSCPFTGKIHFDDLSLTAL